MPVNNLEQLQQMVKQLQGGGMMPANVPIEILNTNDPQVIMNYLEGVVGQSEELGQAVQDYLGNAQKEYKLRQDLVNQLDRTEQVSGPEIPQIEAKTKTYNMKKAQMASNQELLLDPSSEMGTVSSMNFKTAADLYNWLGSQDRSSAENFLMEMVPSEQKEMITSAMEDFYEGNLMEEEKLEIATRLWPIIPDIAKIDKPGIEEGVMELPYKKANQAKQAKQIQKFVKDINDEIKKQAENDAKNAKLVKQANKNKPYNFKKEAQAKTTNNILMYGPGQTRIDPFLRQPVSDWHIVERNKGFGLVLDDVWNIDWESVWRGTVMDKYSRPYRDTKTGEWIGGYIQKRFEVDKNIPEENNMQLLPGQRRKSYIPEKRSIEARLEAMREKEAEKRGYGPASSGSTYDWNTANGKLFNLKKEAENKKKIAQQAYNWVAKYKKAISDLAQAVKNEEISLDEAVEEARSIFSDVSVIRDIKGYDDSEFFEEFSQSPTSISPSYRKPSNFDQIISDEAKKEIRQDILDELDKGDQADQITEASVNKKKIKQADLAPIKDTFDVKPRRPKGSEYIDGPKKELKAQYICRICNAQMPSPSNGTLPTMCACGKYPWSEVAVLVPSKISPDKPGQQSVTNGPSMSRNTMIASCKSCKCANKEKEEKEKAFEDLDLTDCGFESCKSDEIKMMTPFPADNNNEEIQNIVSEEDINQSANDLAIDG